MEEKNYQKEIDEHHDELRMRGDSEIKNLRDRFDRHLEIYAQNGKELAGLKAEVSGLREDIKSVAEGMIYKIEFKPVQRFVYGVVALALSTIFVALFALVIKS